MVRASLKIPGLHLAFSPSHCVAVVKGNNDELRLRYMEHFTAIEDEPSPESRQTYNGHPRFTTHLYGAAIESAAASGLCLTFATTCAQHHFNDDVLAIMQRSLNKGKMSLIQLFINLLTMQSRWRDFSTE